MKSKTLRGILSY